MRRPATGCARGRGSCASARRPAADTRFQSALCFGADAIWIDRARDSQLAERRRGRAWLSFGPAVRVKQVVQIPLVFLTRLQRTYEASGELYRVVRPIKHLDEDRNGYDLTRAFIEEALFFPFAPHDDLIDAASRIYDMQPAAAETFEQSQYVATTHPDA